LRKGSPCGGPFSFNRWNFAGRVGGTLLGAPRFVADTLNQEDIMGRGLLLWLIGIPIPIILIIWLLGGLHG
jgi:hypothetical protein